MTFSLTDDGTLDTVLICDGCGEEARYNFQHDSGEESYDQFVAYAKKDAADDHECTGGAK